MSWLAAPDDVKCSHVACAGYACLYQPPAIGPELPMYVVAADGSQWWGNGGQIFYWSSSSPEGTRPEGRVALVTWHQLRRYEAGGRRWDFDTFPEGPWVAEDSHLEPAGSRSAP